MHTTASNLLPETDTTNQLSVSPTPTRRNQTKSPASTPTKMIQISLQECIARTPEKRANSTQPVIPMTSINTTPTGSSSHGGQIDSGNKRRKSGNASSSTPTKRQKGQPQVGSTVHESNGDGFSYSNQGPDTSATDNEACDDDGLSGTAQHFSIHRLPVESLRSRFKTNLSEVELIERIIKEINEKQTETRMKFENRDASLPIPNIEDNGTSENDNLTFGYQVLVYVQKLEQRDDFLFNFKVYDNTVRLNKIVFYYRPEDIYALTIGQTWQATQMYSCYDFPCHISGRLTSTEGNTQEIAMHLTGNVRVSKSIKKNPTSFDKLKTVMLNVIKPLREKCSLYRLNEFKNCDTQTKLQIGLAYVRIKKRTDLKYLPEILDHFTKICNEKPTYKMGSGGKSIEISTNDFPYIHGVSGEDAREAENNLYELIKGFMHNTKKEQIKKFDIVDKYKDDKYKDDFYNADEFKLIYDNKGTLTKFNSCPTASQIFSKIKESCTDLSGNDVEQQAFNYRLKKHIKLEFTVNGRKEPIQRPIMDLLEGEMTVQSTDYWRLMGRWVVVRDDYYYLLQKEFLDFLKKDKGFFTDPLKANLTKLWNDGNVRNVNGYCKLYEMERGYYLPPCEPELEGMSSQPLESNESDTEVETFSSRSELEDNHFFDMMKISRDDKGKHDFWLYYVFDRFDAGIRDASTRIAKSIEVLLNDSPTPSSKSLLEKFWTHHSENNAETFRRVFSSFESFHKHLTTGSVHIVVAFATQNRQLNTQLSAGTLLSFASIPGGEDDNIPAPTLEREQNLRLSLSLEDFSLLLGNVETEHLNTMYDEFQISPSTDQVNHNLDNLTKKVMDRLVDKKYFERKESSAEVTGKLLKLRNHFDFKMFKNQRVNKMLFKELRGLFITGFPGFIHKLECLQIHENVSKMVRLTLHIVEI